VAVVAVVLRRDLTILRDHSTGTASVASNAAAAQTNSSILIRFLPLDFLCSSIEPVQPGEVTSPGGWRRVLADLRW